MTVALNHEYLQPYSSEVRARFADPQHAGDLPAGPGAVFSASCRESAQGAALQFDAQLDDGVVTYLRFRAFGCPYLIAAAELACQHYQGRPVSDLGDLSAASLLERLQAPVEKTGRMLLLEDTISSLSDLMNK